MSQTILTVDDNLMNLKLIRYLLVKEGFQVRTAEGAQDALELLCTLSPDAVLMDIRMPGINGLQLIRLLRLNQRTRSIPILAVSAHAMPENIQEAYSAGCTGYITKPIDTRTFGGLVQECLTDAQRRQRKPTYLDPDAAALVPPRWDYRSARPHPRRSAMSAGGAPPKALPSQIDPIISGLQQIKAQLVAGNKAGPRE